MSLSLRTVRTILEQGTDKERTRTGELRREHIDKRAAADFGSRKRGRDILEKRINMALNDGAAWDLGRRGASKSAQRAFLNFLAVSLGFSHTPLDSQR